MKKIKTNALAIYMASDEVRESLTTQNLNLRDEVNEKIEIIEDLSGRSVWVHGYDDYSVTVSRNEKSKRYKYPIDILGEEEEEETEEEIISPPINSNYRERVKMSLVAIITAGIILLSIGLYQRDPIETTAASDDPGISWIEQKKEEQNKKNIIIAREYELQKKLREDIALSIERVKKEKKEIEDIERSILLHINP